jgi:XTP/dITP diphosphohydrolase
MNELLFITSNQNKLREVRSILGDKYRILSLKDIEYDREIPEPYDTILQNSVHKANYFFNEYGVRCISEDSGLVVSALGGKPGAHSAHYAGAERDDEKNISKVLTELKDKSDKEAKFISVFTYKDEHIERSFEGEMRGLIVSEPRGNNGFGYDPIFMPDGLSKTNAELTIEEKNAISHRKKALSLLIDFFENY